MAHEPGCIVIFTDIINNYNSAEFFKNIIFFILPVKHYEKANLFVHGICKCEFEIVGCTGT